MYCSRSQQISLVCIGLKNLVRMNTYIDISKVNCHKTLCLKVKEDIMSINPVSFIQYYTNASTQRKQVVITLMGFVLALS